MNYKELKEKEPIYVIGHSNPDLDTIVSSILMSKIFNSLGIKAYYSIIDSNYDIDNYNLNMLNDCISDYNPVVIKKRDILKYNYFIVDHNDPIQSVGYDANIIGGIDHHEDSKQLNNIVLNNYSCNSLYIYDYFKDNYEFTKADKYAIFLATFNDTMFYKNSRYKKEEQALIDSLGFKENVQLYFDKYFINPDFEKGMKYILSIGEKNYKYNNVEFSSCVVKVRNTDQKRMNDFVNEIKNTNKNILGIWMNVDNNYTKAFFKINGNIVEFNYDFLASRAKTVIKDVFKYLNNFT